MEMWIQQAGSALFSPPLDELHSPSVGVWQDELSILGTQVKAEQDTAIMLL